MSGVFGVISSEECIEDLLYGTDYQSHLGTERGGLATLNHEGFHRKIKDISKGAQLKSLFVGDYFPGQSGIGVISDRDPQPLIIGSRHGDFAIVMAGRIVNLEELAADYKKKGRSFIEMSDTHVNQVELAAKIIVEGESIEDGIRNLWEQIEGSASFLILGHEGLYVARDRWGRFPLTLGQKAGAMAVASEPFAFQNTGFQEIWELQPGQITLLNVHGFETLRQGNPANLRICSFLWIYAGYPASVYEGVSVAEARIRCGEVLATRDSDSRLEADQVAGVPDSGRYHAQGYAAQSKLPLIEVLSKYTPGYGRSYTPPSQETRDLIARMKLIAMPELIANKRIVILEDSIVRGTQLKNQTIRKLWEAGAKEVHLRPACPPLLFPCRYALSTLSGDELMARRAIKALEGDFSDSDIEEFFAGQEKYQEMVEWIRQELGLTSLRYQLLADMIYAIGLPANKLCLYCWTG